MKAKYPNGRILAMASAVLLFVASFLPWSKLTVLGVSKSVLGIQGDGVLQIGIAIIALTLLAIPKIKIWIPMTFAIFSGLIAVFDYTSIAAMNRKMDGMSEFGFGFYIVILAIIGLFAGCIWTLSTSRHWSAEQSNLVPDIESTSVGQNI